MILFIKIIIGLGLIAFPIIMGLLKGKVDYAFYYGIVFGFHYDKAYYRVKYEDGEKKNYKLHIFQFHILFVTILLKFAKPAENITVEDE